MHEPIWQWWHDDRPRRVEIWRSLREGDWDDFTPQEPPCQRGRVHETFSGICMVCGAGPDDECQWED